MCVIISLVHRSVFDAVGCVIRVCLCAYMLLSMSNTVKVCFVHINMAAI